MHTQASLPAIGAAFGGRNHTTVMHAVTTCPPAAGIVGPLTDVGKKRERGVWVVN